MKFEEFWKNGKYYKTNDGKKVRIYACNKNDTHGLHDLHGALLMHDGSEYFWHTIQWSLEGKYGGSSDPDNFYHIVGEWDEENICPVVSDSVDAMRYAMQGMGIGVDLSKKKEPSYLEKNGMYIA